MRDKSGKKIIGAGGDGTQQYVVKEEHTSVINPKYAEAETVGDEMYGGMEENSRVP